MGGPTRGQEGALKDQGPWFTYRRQGNSGGFGKAHGYAQGRPHGSGPSGRFCSMAAAKQAPQGSLSAAACNIVVPTPLYQR